MIAPGMLVCSSFLICVCMFIVSKALLIVCCSVNVSVCFVCCVFVNCLVKQFAMYLGVVTILLLNVMVVFSVSGGALLDRPCMVFQRMCVLCL